MALQMTFEADPAVAQLQASTMHLQAAPATSPKSASSTAVSSPPAKRHCWECLRRRLVCDAGQPFCRKCHNAGVVCPGYDDKKPLKWIANGRISSRPRQPRARTNSNSNDPAAPTPARKSSKVPTKKAPKLAAGKKKPQAVVTINAVEEKAHMPEHSGCLAILPHVDLRSTTCDVVQAAYYYNTWVLPSYDSTLALAPNPYITRFPMEILPYLTDGLRHTVVALAIGHRIHQLPQEASRGATVDLWSRLFHHRCLAIRELSSDIASEDKRASDSTIVTILLFLFVELQQMPATNWRQHLDGLTQLIELRGGPRKFLEALPSLQIGLSSFFMYVPNSALNTCVSFYLWVGVMANTTCPPLCDNSAMTHYELTDMLTTMYGDGSYPTCLCPPALFITIIKINHLRAQQALANVMVSTNRSISPPTQQPLLPENGSKLSLNPKIERRDSDDIGSDLDSCYALGIVDDACIDPALMETTFPTPPEDSQPQLSETESIEVQANNLLKAILAYVPEEEAAKYPDFRDERLVLGRMWQSALVIYLIASLQSLGALRSPFRRGQLSGIRAIHSARLFDQLQVAVKSPQLKKSVLWPLVVCGFDSASAVSKSSTYGIGNGNGGGDLGGSRGLAAEKRNFVAAQLPVLGYEVGTSLPEYARKVLRKFWDSGLSEWDSCFDMPYAFVT